MDWEFWIIALVVVLLLAVAYTSYGRRARATGIDEHPIEERPGAPDAGEPRG